MRLSRRDEILLYLSEQSRELSEIMPRASSQTGIAEALGHAQTVVSMICTDLELQRLAESQKAHVAGLPYRVRCYVLTAQAEPHIRLAVERLKLAEAEAELASLLSSIQVSVSIKDK